MKNIEIDPKTGSPILTESPKIRDAHKNEPQRMPPFDTEQRNRDFDPPTKRPEVQPDNQNVIGTTVDNPEQNPHTDGKENDIFSEPGVSVPSTSVPPSLLPPSNQTPSPVVNRGFEDSPPPNMPPGYRENLTDEQLRQENQVGRGRFSPVTGPTQDTRSQEIQDDQISKAEVIRSGLESGDIVADTANTPIPQFRILPPEKKKERDELRENIRKALVEYGGESNIPYTHAYWNWQNQLRNL